MPPFPVLGLDDPGVGIEADFLGEALFDRSFWPGVRRERAEEAVERPRVIIEGLRRWREQQGAAIHQRDLDEDCASLLGTSASYRAKNACPLTASQIGGDPDVGFQSHGKDDR